MCDSVRSERFINHSNASGRMKMRFSMIFDVLRISPFCIALKSNSSAPPLFLIAFFTRQLKQWIIELLSADIDPH
jgi:hypothetical protein